MALIAIGLELHRDGPEAVQLVKRAAKKIVAPDADPDPDGVGILTWTTQIAATHPEAQAAADRVLDECAEELSWDRRSPRSGDRRSLAGMRRASPRASRVARRRVETG